MKCLYLLVSNTSEFSNTIKSTSFYKLLETVTNKSYDIILRCKENVKLPNNLDLAIPLKKQPKVSIVRSLRDIEVSSILLNLVNKTLDEVADACNLTEDDFIKPYDFNNDLLVMFINGKGDFNYHDNEED